MLMWTTQKLDVLLDFVEQRHQARAHPLERLAESADLVVALDLDRLGDLALRAALGRALERLEVANQRPAHEQPLQERLEQRDDRERAQHQQHDAKRAGPGIPAAAAPRQRPPAPT